MENEQSHQLLFDDVLRQAGGSGRWQLYQSLWISKLGFVLVFFNMGMIFLGDIPEHRCADGFPEDVTFNDLPLDTPQCSATDTNDTCTRWVFDTDGTKFTMTTEWNLVCERRHLLSLIQSVSMMGGLVGALSSGVIGDRFGRRPTMLFGCALHTITMFAMVAARNLYLLLALRFLCGVGTSIIVIPTVVVVMEFLTPEWRMLGGLLLQVPYSIGMMVLAGLGYALQVWWHLQLVMSATALLFVVDYWILPESPRWLVMNGRLPEAAAVLQTIGRVNGSPLPDTDTLLQSLTEVQNSESILLTSNSLAQEEVGGCRVILASLWQLIRTPRLRVYMLATVIIWLACGLSYFGLAFEVGQLSDNFYVANCLVGLLEIPACLLPWFFAVRWGRRPTCVAFFLLGAATILPTALTSDSQLLMALGLLGKFGVSGAFCLVFIYTPEYIPTTVRSVGQATATVAARIGSMVAPFIIGSASQLHHTVPTILFGGMCVVASVFTLLLPETAGRRLPETITAVASGAWRFERTGHSENLRDLLGPGGKAKKDHAGQAAMTKCLVKLKVMDA